MARKRDSGWIWIAIAAIGGAIIVAGMALRTSGTLGGPGFALYDITSRSMLPRLHVGDKVFALANVYRDEVPPRGQIVGFKYPPDGKTDYIKRVIGLPRDRIQLRSGLLYINDQLIPRDPVADANVGDVGDAGLHIYRETLPEGATTGELDNTSPFIVPAGDVFMLGDNRDNSNDSRTDVGYVPLSLLRDEAYLIFWASDLSRIGQRIE